MTRTLVLDTGPAGRIANPHINEDIRTWLVATLKAGDIIILPEIVDYELRRNFLLEVARGRTSFRQSLERLDELKHIFSFQPIDSATMLLAAEFWAQARRRGRSTGDPRELDGDMILAAQARQVNGTVVTENIGHLALFIEAKSWQEL